MFLERLQNYGMETSPYYIYGGDFNHYTYDNQLPNCTTFDMLRTYEATEAKTPYPIAQNNLGFPVAKDWIKYSPLPKGSELRLGSIVCFDGNFGHVAFVERVLDKTHALISQSQYDSNKSLRNYKYFETREVKLVVGEATLDGIGKLQGFIYTPINDIRVKRDKNKEQIEITQSMVNVRTKPNGILVAQGCYAPMGIYNVEDKQIVDGYTWYQLEENHWVREGEWLKYYGVDNIDNIIKENEELKKILKEIHTLSEVG